MTGDANTWDVIVLGLGGVGSAAVWHLATSGCRVLGLEQYRPAHAHGSSHGQTRIIRQAYFEDPAYVPLLRRAYQLWDHLEQQTGQSLFVRCGLIQLGPADGVIIPGVLRSAVQHRLPIEPMTSAEITRRWPGIHGDRDWQGVLETNAGFLRVEQCVLAQLELAQRAGAICRFGTPAIDWKADGGGVVVTTSGGQHRAERLLIAGGSWSTQLLGSLQVKLQVLRKHLYWFETDTHGYSLDEGFPCFFHDTEHGFFYGFPALDTSGVKVARHSGGEPLSGPDHVPSAVDLDHDDYELVLQYTRRYLPGVSPRLAARAGCYYTNSPDEHFIIDRHPELPQVTIIAGLSGHGFKFVTVLGEIACDLVRDATSPLDLSPFRIDRNHHAPS